MSASPSRNLSNRRSLHYSQLIQQFRTGITKTNTNQVKRSTSLRSFDPEVLTIYYVRKFVGRARDYMRAYRLGTIGLGAETAIKKYKTHWSMLDVDFKFVSKRCEKLPRRAFWPSQLWRMSW